MEQQLADPHVVGLMKHLPNGGYECGDLASRKYWKKNASSPLVLWLRRPNSSNTTIKWMADYAF